MEIEILFIWFFINSVSAIYYTIRNPYTKETDELLTVFIAFMFSGTFWLFWLLYKIANKFGVLNKNGKNK
jgi:hypothetical protein